MRPAAGAAALPLLARRRRPDLAGPLVPRRLHRQHSDPRVLCRDVALTVDVLWGHMRHAHLRPVRLLRHRRLCCWRRLHAPRLRTGQPCGVRRRARAALPSLAAFVGWLAFGPGATPLYASVITLVLPDRGDPGPLFRRLLYRLQQRALRLRELRTCHRGLVSHRRPGARALTAVTRIVTSQRRRPAPRRHPRQRDALPLSRHRSTAPEDPLFVLSGGSSPRSRGFVYAGFSGVVAPENASFVFGTELVIWVALGGRGTLIGPVLGALLIDVAQRLSQRQLPFVWELILGIVFVSSSSCCRGVSSPFGRRVAARAVAKLPDAGLPADAWNGGRRLRTVRGGRGRRGRRRVASASAACRFLIGIAFYGTPGRTRQPRRPERRRQDDADPLHCRWRRALGDGRVMGRIIDRLPPERIVALGSAASSRRPTSSNP